MVAKDKGQSARGGQPAGRLLKQPRPELMEARSMGQGGSRGNEDRRNNQILIKNSLNATLRSAVLCSSLAQAKTEIKKKKFKLTTNLWRI